MCLYVKYLLPQPCLNFYAQLCFLNYAQPYLVTLLTHVAITSLPGGLLDEDGASRSAVRSALNPEAGSFEPRGYMPQVAEDDENRQRTEAAAAPEEKERAAAERAAVL